MADTPAPKSPSPRRTSGKQRAVRIPLDYFKTRDSLGRIRFVLVTLAPIVALALRLTGKPDDIDGRTAMSGTIDMRDGKVFLGPMPIVELPKVF